MNKGIELWNHAKHVIPGGTQLLSKRSELFLPEQWPAYFDEANGVDVWDLDGNHYIDMCIMGVGSCVLGYGDDSVNRAVKAVIDRGSMCTLNSPEEVKLADVLLKLHSWAGMVRYARTGGEAMSIAVRIARAYSGLDNIAFCGYHGWHDWYLAANLADDKALDGHLLPGLEPRGVPRALRGTAIPFRYNHGEELAEITENHKIGAVVLEVVRHEYPQRGFIEQVSNIASKTGAVLIFDEITTGFRLALPGVHIHYVEPDIVVYAKAMSNGYPMAAIVGRHDVMQAAQDTFISSTYWTERIGPAAALATIGEIESHDVIGKISFLGDYLRQELDKLGAEHKLHLKVSGIGSIVHIDFGSLVRQTQFTRGMLKRGYLAGATIYLSFAHDIGVLIGYLSAVNEVLDTLNEVEDSQPVAHAGFKRLV